ncbi:hypothetical protein D3C77_327930 [compost metagenome]
MPNRSSNSPSLHIIVQNDVGLGPICKIRRLRNCFTTFAAATKFVNPRSNTGESTRLFVTYVNGTLKRRRTFPVANSPHCVSRRRMPSSSGASSRGPHSSTGLPNALPTLATVSSVPKLQCGKKTASTFSRLNRSTILSAAI